MGRYYSGDIDGKFWFAVQRTNAADRFGVHGMEPQYIQYFFDQEHLEGVQEEISNIENKIGKDNLTKLDDFFNNCTGYNDEILKENGMLDIYNEHMEDYADLKLGREIEKSIMETGRCYFDAEY